MCFGCYICNCSHAHTNTHSWKRTPPPQYVNIEIQVTSLPLLQFQWGQRFCWPIFFPKFAKILNGRRSHFLFQKTWTHSGEQHKLWLSPMSIYHCCSLHCIQAMLSYQIRSKNLGDICANSPGKRHPWVQLQGIRCAEGMDNQAPDLWCSYPQASAHLQELCTGQRAGSERSELSLSVTDPAMQTP